MVHIISPNSLSKNQLNYVTYDNLEMAQLIWFWGIFHHKTTFILEWLWFANFCCCC